MATSSQKKKEPRTILSFFSKSTADKELRISVQDPNNAPSTSGTENLDQMPVKTTETPKLPVYTLVNVYVDFLVFTHIAGTS